MTRGFVLGVVAAVLLALAANASAGGHLTLKSLDKRLRALTALVILDRNSPPTLATMEVNAPMYPQGGSYFQGSVNCGTGWQVTGGGVSIRGAGTGAATLVSEPGSLNDWKGEAYAPGNAYAGGAPTVTVFAVCSQVEPG